MTAFAPALQRAEPDPDTLYRGEEGQQHADCRFCGDDIFLDQEFDPMNDGEPTPPDDKAYWQHNDDSRYLPGRLSWCKP